MSKLFLVGSKVAKEHLTCNLVTSSVECFFDLVLIFNDPKCFEEHVILMLLLL